MNDSTRKDQVTLVIGASINPDRYAHKAVVRLMQQEYPVIAFGNKGGKIEGIKIHTDWEFEALSIDTVSLYVRPSLQVQYQQKIVSLKPRRVIFNPGTENTSFKQLLKANGIESEYACTLVLLSTGSYFV